MKHLLLVDNDPDILELLRIGLEELGFTVRTALSGLEALRTIENDLPDVLITDLVMPHINGEKLLKIVRAVPEWSNLRTIVISGVAAEAPEIRNRLPCDVYIAKGPVARMLDYIGKSIEAFRNEEDTIPEGVLGIEETYSRHITRELFEFKAEVDSIMDQIADGICRLDQSGTILWINQAFERLFRQPEEQVLGRPLCRVLPENERGGLEDFLLTRNPNPVEIELNSESPRRVLRLTRLAPLTGDDQFVTLLCQDVTERLLSEEQYENIVQSTSDLVLTTDLEGRIDFASRSSRHVAGRDAEALRHQHLWVLAPREEAQQIRRRFRETVSRFLENETRPDRDSWEMHLHGTEEESRLGSVTCAPYRNRAGSIMGIQLVITDITERRRLEDERTALLHEVQHRVRDNLQLVASLVRLSDPETMDMRISTVSEVFDELYREQSFSRIPARSLLERVVSLGISEVFCGSRNPVQYRIEGEYIPMRTAVPLSLIVVEVLREIAGRDGSDGSDCALLVALTSGEDDMELTITCGDAETAEAGAAGKPEQDGIISILAGQINARCHIHEGPSFVRYSVAARSAEPQVP